MNVPSRANALLYVLSEISLRPSARVQHGSVKYQIVGIQLHAFGHTRELTGRRVAMPYAKPKWALPP